MHPGWCATLPLLFISCLDVVAATTSIHVLTFNIWGIFTAKQRPARLDAIISELQKPSQDGGKYGHDIVALQEVWDDSDYVRLVQGLATLYPYSHHFTHGYFGTGLAVFSKHRIQKIEFMPFRVNGRMEAIFDGDWYAGKGVGYALIDHPAGDIHLFTSHLIADYSTEPRGHLAGKKDEYLADRTLQAYQMSRFIQSITNDTDRVLLMGDLNFELSALPAKLFRCQSGGLSSVWDGLAPSDTPCTCNCRDISFFQDKSASQRQKLRAITIDHIFYRGLQLNNVETVFRGRFKGSWGRTISYSDHYAVSAEFTLNAPDESRKNVACDASVWVEAKHTARQQVESLQKLRRSSSWRGNLNGILALSIMGLAVFFLTYPYLETRFVMGSTLMLVPVTSVLCCWNRLISASYVAQLAALLEMLAELEYSSATITAFYQNVLSQISI